MNMELYAYVRDLAQCTDIAIILENLGEREMAVNMTMKVLRCMAPILKRPEKAPEPCPAPINNTAVCVRDMMNIYFDTQWGGLITGWFDRFAPHYCQCDKPGGPYACRGFNYCDNPRGFDAFANYGNAFYNDHHFQYGYILKNLGWAVYFQETKGAPLGMNATVLRNITKQALAFARDIGNPDPAKDKYFAFLRHKDVFDGHSWAEGYDYSGRVVGWINQQSGGEAINGYYGIYLLGLALNDTNVMDWGRIHLATEASSISHYQHLSNRTASGKKDMPDKIEDQWGKCMPILFGNGNSGATYYGPNPLFQCGITFLPVTPLPVSGSTRAGRRRRSSGSSGTTTAPVTASSSILSRCRRTHAQVSSARTGPETSGDAARRTKGTSTTSGSRGRTGSHTFTHWCPSTTQKRHGRFSMSPATPRALVTSRSPTRTRRARWSATNPT